MTLIGIPCQGIVDLRKLIERTGEEITAYSEDQDVITIHYQGAEHTFAKEDVLHDSCLRCLHPNPVNVDILIGEPLPEGNPNLVREKVAAFQALSRDERYDWFRQEAERCIVVMPAIVARCYCTECLSITTSRVESSVLLPEPTHGIFAQPRSGRCTLWRLRKMSNGH